VIKELRHIISLNILYRILVISKSSYYYARIAVNKEDKDFTIKPYIEKFFTKIKEDMAIGELHWN